MKGHCKELQWAVVAFKPKPKVLDALARLEAWAKGKPVRICFHEQTPLPKSCESKAVARVNDKGLGRMDLVLSFGGDGTLLSSARRMLPQSAPLAGINVGGLGFLAGINPENMEADLDLLVAGKYRVEERMMLDVSVWRNKKKLWSDTALNEAVVSKWGVVKLLDLSAWCGDKFISRFWVDGLIVATPTGSTAYSLAAGGPILEPSLEAVVMTPICPHALTERPMILSSRRTLRIVVQEKKPPALVTVDGKEQFSLAADDEVRIQRSPRITRLVRLGEGNHFETLRNKLHWSRK